jgi:rhamnosyltransferase
VPFVSAHDSTAPRVTVFIPTWNGGPLFEEVLRELAAQETEFPYEILCIDSGSKDGTVERARAAGCRVVEIPNSDFNHGLTRNRAVHEARGEVVALTVQDATPASRDWLRVMTSHFADPEVAGVFCHQAPRPDCSPFLRDRLRSWVRGGGEPSVRRVSSVEEFWALHPTERWMRAQFDNVASCVRRSFALEHPFPRRQFGEDVTWAKGAILALRKVVMEPRVAVIHSHRNSMWYEFKRAYLDHQNINDLFGTRLAPRLRDVFAYAADATRRLWRVVGEDPTLGPVERWIWRAKAAPFAFTQNLGQYLGPLSNVQGRRGLWRWWDRLMRRRV